MEDYTEIRKIPKGVRVFLPEDTARQAKIEKTLEKVFKRWGFFKIATPVFEFYNSIKPGWGKLLDRIAYKFTGPGGDTLVLKPDMTAPLARVVASNFRSTAPPLRLYYITPVYRFPTDSMVKKSEIYQAGAELIGVNGAGADAEIIALAADCVKGLNIKNYRIDLSQVGFFSNLLKDLELSPADIRKIKNLVYKKEERELDRFLRERSLKKGSIEKILRLTTLYGKSGVLNEASALVVNGEMEKDLKNLSDVCSMLDKYGLAGSVSIDFGLVRGLDYYTGIIFDVFAEGIGSALISGGRYDNLIKKYGYDTPATGFALDAGLVLDSLSSSQSGFSGERTDYLVVNSGVDAGEAIAFIMKLRDSGYSAEAGLALRDREGHISYAKDRHIKNIIFLEPSRYPKQAYIHSADSGSGSLKSLKGVFDGE